MKRNSNGNFEIKKLHLYIIIVVLIVSASGNFFAMDKRMSVHEVEDKYIEADVALLKLVINRMEGTQSEIIKKLDSLIIVLGHN